MKIVVLTGAGISAESGIKTFRDSDGLWNGYRIEDVATPEAWAKDPQLVLDFYNMRRRELKSVQPNAAHEGLAKLGKAHDVHIITQNVDDLHERAGSTQILHLHGELRKMRSDKNPALVYEIDDDIRMGDFADDGAQLRPHIVWFGEDVPMMEYAIETTKLADIFIIIGTSLQVYPAAGLIHFFQGDCPIYIIDRKIPGHQHWESPRLHGTNIVPLEKPATEGVAELLSQLMHQ